MSKAAKGPEPKLCKITRVVYGCVVTTCSSCNADFAYGYTPEPMVHFTDRSSLPYSRTIRLLALYHNCDLAEARERFPDVPFETVTATVTLGTDEHPMCEDCFASLAQRRNTAGCEHPVPNLFWNPHAPFGPIDSPNSEKALGERFRELMGEKLSAASKSASKSKPDPKNALAKLAMLLNKKQ